jgi:hypothetical protein
MTKSLSQPKDILAPHLAMLEALAQPYTTPPIGLSPDVSVKKKGEPLDGTCGILSGVVLDGDKIDAELAVEREKNRVFAEREQALAKTLKDIDAAFAKSPWLNERLHKCATERIPKEVDETFQRFCAHCEGWGFPFLPSTVPQALATFLTAEATNARDAKRLLSHIESAYERLDPRLWRDALVTAIKNAFQDEEPSKPH